jgi:hypothetical protein
LSAILSLPISAFWAWVAYSAIGFSSALAREVFMVFGALSLLFCPCSTSRMKGRFVTIVRKHLLGRQPLSSPCLPLRSFYFIAKHERETIFPIVYGAVTLGLGVYVSLFAIKYEFE